MIKSPVPNINELRKTVITEVTKQNIEKEKPIEQSTLKAYEDRDDE